MTGNKTEMLVDLICELKDEAVSEEITLFIKQCVLDYLGVTFAGAHDLKDKINEYLDSMSEEAGSISVIGCGRKTSLLNAALINGMSAHYFELDDGSRFGMVHLGAPILSALLAVAQAYEVKPKDFIQAVFVGYEVAIRLASATQPGHKKKGFHATGTCGCIGAAAAIAVARRFDKVKINNTIAASVASCSGLLEMIQNRSQLKPFNAGNAAMNAIIASITGSAGFVGPEDPIGGTRGFLGVMADDLNDEWLSRDGDKRYTITGIYRKPYASCRHCHSSVEAALNIIRNNDVSYDKIKSITIQTYKLAVFGHDHTVIEGTGSAKMSIPYSVAAAFVLKNGGMSSMSENAINDERIISLTKRVTVCENPDYSVLVPAKRISKLTVEMKNGDQLSEEVVYPKGEPENPISENELIDKFIEMSQYAGVSEKIYNNIIKKIYDIENSFDSILSMI